MDFEITRVSSFLISLCYRYSLELLCSGESDEYPQCSHSIFHGEIGVCLATPFSWHYHAFPKIFRQTVWIHFKEQHNARLDGLSG